MLLHDLFTGICHGGVIVSQIIWECFFDANIVIALSKKEKKEKEKLFLVKWIGQFRSHNLPKHMHITYFSSTIEWKCVVWSHPKRDNFNVVSGLSHGVASSSSSSKSMCNLKTKHHDIKIRVPNHYCLVLDLMCVAGIHLFMIRLRRGMKKAMVQMNIPLKSSN